MDDGITHDELMAVLGDIGKAIGFALGEVIASTGTSTTHTLIGIEHGLRNLADADRFSPNVTLVMNGIGDGLEARRQNPTPDPDEPGELV